MGYPIFDGTERANVRIPMDDGFSIGKNSSLVGEVTVTGATPVVVNNKNITANSIVVFGLKTVGGTVGNIPTVKTITAGTSFTVAGTASDTSTYVYFIINLY